MFYLTHTHTHTHIQLCERGKRTGLVLLPPVTPDMKGGLRRSLSGTKGRAD